jgi:hypothetical protein
MVGRFEDQSLFCSCAKALWEIALQIRIDFIAMFNAVCLRRLSIRIEISK